ncbi:MAG: hypothetical protein RLZZ584_4537 [Pseudomonadota bacterium]
MSEWWSVKRQLPGWVAVVPGAAHAQAAHVVWPAGAQPQLRWACELGWSDPAAGLRQLRREHQLRQHRSVALLQRHQYQLLPMDAPEVPREAWRDAVRWKLKDMVDFAVDDAGIDLLEIPPDTSQRGRTGLLVAAAPRAALTGLVHAADDAGTPWQALDIAETALRNIANLAGHAGDTALHAQALLGVGETGSWLVVTAHGELLLARNIELTRVQACASSRDPLPDAAPAPGTHPDPVLDAHHEHELELAPGASAGATTDTGAEAARRLRDRVALEVQRTLDHCDRLFNRVSLVRLLIGPGLPDDFVDDLRELLYLPVTGFDLAELLDLSAVPALTDPAEQSRYLHAIGAALRPQ